MERGTLINWMPERCFGFIRRANGRDVFAHVSEITEEIEVGCVVEFEVREETKGPRALNIHRAEGATK